MVNGTDSATCRQCGCTDINACVDLMGFPCFWVEPDLCSRCYEEIDAPPDFGDCCACLKGGAAARNVLFLPRQNPEPGPGCWGCAQCGLAMEGAVAVLCDDCMGQGEPPIRAIVGPVAEHRRIPIGHLFGRHQHDLWLHPEVPKNLVDHQMHVWMEAADVCEWCLARYQVKIDDIESPHGQPFGDIVYRIIHKDDCPEYSGEAPVEESDFAGWVFAEGMTKLGFRDYPTLSSRANVGPCLRCWRLIVVMPLSLLGNNVQLDFCLSCAKDGGIFDLLKR